MASVRAVLAALTMAGVILWLGQSVWPQGREWRDWIVLGTLNGWVPNLLVAYALERMDSGPAALIQASGPLMTALLAHAVLPGERMNAPRLAGLADRPLRRRPADRTDRAERRRLHVRRHRDAHPHLCYALGNIYVRLIPQADPMRLALGQQAASAVAATAIALTMLGAGAFAPALGHVGPLLALGVLGTAIPIAIFMRLIRAAGPARASMTGYLVPVVAVLLGILVLGETLALRQIAGGLIVLAGVGLVTGAIRWPARRAATS